MRALLSFQNFDVFGGTESYSLTVAQELGRLGHEVSIFTRNAGAMADFARDQGIAVIGPDQLPSDCDAVFAQDAATAYELAAAYPQATRVLVAHSRDYALQYAPQLPDVCDAVVVLNDRVRRWVESQAWHPPVTRLRQPIDLGRFSDLGPARDRPRRVLVSSNYVAGPRAERIEWACREAGLDVDWIGITTDPTSSPERALGAADIVIGLGRSALEAMAAGRAVYVYGVMGGDGWVTPQSYPQLESDGFGGLATARVLDASQLAADLRRWNRDMGVANRDLTCAGHSARDHVIELVKLARALGGESAERRAEPAGGPATASELARLVRLEWQSRVRGQRAVLDANELRAERERHVDRAERAGARVVELDRHLAEASARVAELDAQLREASARVAELDARVAELEASHQQAERRLRELVATRRYRLARLAVAPLDRVRAGRSARRRTAP